MAENSGTIFENFQYVPFAVKLNATPTADDAIAAMRTLSALSQANGNSQMNLEEINAEIAAAKKHR